jgi:hypothetical protein
VRKALTMSACLALLCFFLLGAGSLQSGSAPGQSQTLIAGPYTIDVTLSQNPPFTDQPFEISVAPHGSNRTLSGLVVAEPGLGTDATNLQTTLTPSTTTHGAVSGWLHIPVRGSWQLVFHLDGPLGQSSTSLALTVGAPGAMPVWLAWSIAMIPLLFIAWWVYWQRLYRGRLLREKGQLAETAP